MPTTGHDAGTRGCAGIGMPDVADSLMPAVLMAEAHPHIRGRSPARCAVTAPAFARIDEVHS